MPTELSPRCDVAPSMSRAHVAPITNHSPDARQTRRTRLLKVIGAFGAVYLIWGSTFLGIRIAIDSIPPMLMAGTRWIVAGAAPTQEDIQHAARDHPACSRHEHRRDRLNRDANAEKGRAPDEVNRRKCSD
jgi:hypothetical protein